MAERLRAAEEASATARAVGDRFREIGVEYLRGNALLNSGDLDGAEAAFSQTDFRGALEGWAIADFRAARAIAEGRFAEAAVLADVAHGLGAALGDTNDGIRALQQWSVARLTGDFEAAHRWAESDASAVGQVVPTDALTYLTAGDEVRAGAALAAWVRDVQPLMPAIMRYSALAYLAQLVFQLGAFDGLDASIEYAERFPGELIGSDAGIVGAADAARGRFAAVRGDLDRAVELLEAGHALHTRLGLHQLVVESGLDLGIVLLRRDGADDSAARDGAAAFDGRPREHARDVSRRGAGRRAHRLKRNT